MGLFDLFNEKKEQTSSVKIEDTNEDRFSKMVKNASFNPFRITCEPSLQNTRTLPNLRSTFIRELNDLYQILNRSGQVGQKILIDMSTGYVFNLVESYYKNAGYVPKNALDQILEQVYDAMQQTGFRNTFSSLESFKYNCYYGYLNR